MGKVPGAATIQTRTTIGTSTGHWSRAHRTMCPDGEGSWCGYNTDQDNYRHKYEMGSTPVSRTCAYSCPGLYCSCTRNLTLQGTWFYGPYSSVPVLVPIVVLVCIVAAPGTLPFRAHGSMGPTPVSHACAYSCPGLYCSRTRNLPHQGTWFYEFYSSVSCLCL